MKREQVDQNNLEISPLRLPPELKFLLRWKRYISSWEICHAGKIFPVDTYVTVRGCMGIYRVISNPYVLWRNGLPHLDVEAFGERICVNIIEIAPISN
jgi:hypothetical protein